MNGDELPRNRPGPNAHSSVQAKNEAIRAEREADMYGSLSLFYVYCEVVEPVLVGHAQFLPGKTVVVLEFRRAVHPYLSIQKCIRV